jgi:signal transduction histidine kinase
MHDRPERERAPRDTLMADVRLPPVSLRRIAVRFILISTLGLVALAGLTALLSRRIATQEAIIDARRITTVISNSLVREAVTPQLLAGDPAAIAAFGEVVKGGIVPLSMVRTKLWDHSGRLLYSDEPRLIGQRFPFSKDATEVLATGDTHAEVSDLSDAENKFDKSGDSRLLEVYARVTPKNGKPLLFETYFSYNTIRESSRRVWRSFAPVAIGALLLLQLLQFPLAWRTARRLRRSQDEREHLLSAAIESSSAERRRIARDLHDGTVQDLAGVSLELAAASRRASKRNQSDTTASDDDARLLDHASARVRNAITSLRTLLVDLYPPNLDDTGIAQALSDLTSRLSARGIEPHVEIDLPDRPLRRETSALLHRIAQEAQRNVIRHASATEVTLRITHDPSNVVMQVSDDGTGFDVAAAIAHPAEGHVGLRVLQDLVTEAGGSMTIHSDLGVGTTIQVELPQ